MIDHRIEAEKHLANAARHLTEDVRDMRIAEVSAWIGQGHANLARNEEQAATTADLRDALTLLRRRNHAMRELIATHIVEALTSQGARAKAALHLARDLDEADANVDDLINEKLPATGWAPTSAAPDRDPSTPAPDITADIPERVRRVITERLADMLLSHQDDGWGAEQARRFAFALKNAGADLTADIEKRITELTLGPDLSDPPF